MNLFKTIIYHAEGHNIALVLSTSCSKLAIKL